MQTLKTIIICLVVFYTSLSIAQNPAITKIRDCTVGIVVDTPRGPARGTGIIFTCRDKVYVMTAGHVVSLGRVAGFKRTKTESQQIIGYAPIIVEKMVENGKDKKNERFQATMVHNGLIHDNIDVAILMLMDVKPWNSVNFDFDDPYIGTPTLHCGQFPDNELITTNGIVSEVYVSVNEMFYHEATNRVQPGSSGGGIFYDDGNCIGILIAETNVGCAFVPSGEILNWLKKKDLNWLVDNSNGEDNILTMDLD